MARTLLFLVIVGCSSSASPTRTPPIPVAPAPPPTPNPATESVRLQPLACGYGGSATAVSGFVDVETDQALDHVTATFVVRDPSTHAVLGHNAGDVALAVSPVARGTLDFSTQGTTPFSGALAAGAHVRLQYFAGLDGAPPTTGGPLEVVLLLTDSTGHHRDATCTTATEWPSS